MTDIFIQCVEGTREGETFEFRGKAVLGRGEDCDLQLEDSCCSRRHAEIERHADRFTIKDLGSRNGVVVNGERVAAAVLRYGDRFDLGRTRFVFLSEVIDPNEERVGLFHDVEMIDVREAETRLTQDLTALVGLLRPAGGVDDRGELGRPECGRGDHEGDHQGDGEGDGREHDRGRDPGDDRADHRSDRPPPRLPEPVRDGAIGFLWRVVHELNGMLESAGIVKTVTRAVFEEIRSADRVVFFLFEPSDPPGLREADALLRREDASRPVSRSILRRVEQERRGILCGNAVDFSAAESIRAGRVSSFMCVPIVAGSSLLGAIHVESVSRRRAFCRREFELLTLVANHSAATLANAFLFERSQEAYLETVRSLGKALEAKDSYTRGHSERVAGYALGIARRFGLDAERLANLRIAAELHDIGKIAIRDEIIGKDGRLTPEEFDQIRKHPELGVEILRPIRLLRPILPFVLHHHERYNGRGYPEGLEGEEIPLEARIINLADALDAMTTQRSYNKPMSMEAAMERCREEAGLSFDPDCVAALVAHTGEGRGADSLPAADGVSLCPHGVPRTGSLLQRDVSSFSFP